MHQERTEAAALILGEEPGQVVKNAPHDAGGLGSVPGWGSESPHAVEQQRPRAPEPTRRNWRVHALQLSPSADKQTKNNNSKKNQGKEGNFEILKYSQC